MSISAYVTDMKCHHCDPVMTVHARCTPGQTLATALSNHKHHYFLMVMCNGFGKHRQIMLSCQLLPIEVPDKKGL